MKDKRDDGQKFATLFEAGKKCCLILDHLYSEIELTAQQASDRATLEADPLVVPKLNIAALGLVDYLHRFHEIITAMPFLTKDMPEVKALGTALMSVRNCRNYLQHMGGRLKSDAKINYPILGALSWIHDGRNYMLFLNQNSAQFSAPGIAYDRATDTYVCKYQLVVGGTEVRLDTAFHEVKTFWAWLDKVSDIKPPEIKSYAWGKPNIVHSEIVQASQRLAHPPDDAGEGKS